MPVSDGNADIAYSLLEHRITSYRYRPGMRLSPDRLSGDIRIGLTPTRTALYWLHRDGVIDHRSGQGFFVKTPSVDEMRGLYRGNMIQLTGAICFCLDDAETGAQNTVGQEREAAEWEGFARQNHADTLVAMTETLFNSIAALSKSDVVTRSVELINSRLFFARLVEHDLIDDVAGELYVMQSLLREGKYNRLSSAVAAYHETRFDNAHELTDAVCARALRQQAA